MLKQQSKSQYSPNPFSEGISNMNVCEDNMQRYLSKEGLANHLDVSVGLINKKLKELPHIKWGNHKNARVLFPVIEIEKYFENVSLKQKEPSD